MTPALPAPARLRLPPLDVPVRLDRDAARERARAELAEPEYLADRPGLIERGLGWLYDRIGELLGGVSGLAPGGAAGLVVLALLAAAAVVVARRRLGPLGASRRGGEPLFTGRARTAAQHRAAADAHAGAGEWAQAVRERTRALIRGLEERGLLEDRPGRTAEESAAEAGRALPGLAADLRLAAATFGEVWYGGRPATREADAALRAVDERARADRPAPAGR